jgi:hypothetical protein
MGRSAPHTQNRAEEYAKLVAALHAWYTAVTSARAGRLNAGLLGEEGGYECRQASARGHLRGGGHGQVLLVLDDATGHEQVRPLLPAPPEASC